MTRVELDVRVKGGWGQETLGSLQGQRQAGLGPQSEIFTWDGIWMASAAFLQGQWLPFTCHG